MNIKVEALSKKINGAMVLKDISCEFASGNIYGIVGKNGSGKTMLLREIAGLIRPTKGSISVDGKILHHDISFPPNLGLIIEKPDFLNYLTGFENLKILAEIRHRVTDDKIKDLMKKFSLEPNSKQTVKKYSLGMKQKIGIIQAIMENPDILILDEPFNALDEDTVLLVRNLLLQYRKDGKLIVITSHHREDIDAICNHIYRMEEGQLIAAN
ncbi:ABC transporter ATP-binding protein [Pseudoflavonifractor sp. CLA-AP-H29]|uniref:ABC transporter ATP-binding protein n=1 Tax=Pseudoflavonifractor intestinihominis TaxID=3133171 RepID=A0ABV1EE83_9FIRM